LVGQSTCLATYSLAECKDDEADASDVVASSSSKRWLNRREMLPPGRRSHDNDKENFRDISIVPTISEMNSDQLPFVPSANEGTSRVSDPLAALLDQQYRLMREDMLGPIRDELSEELKALHSKGPKQCKLLFQKPRVDGIGLRPEPNFQFLVPLTPRLQRRIYRLADEAYALWEQKLARARDAEKKKDATEGKKHVGDAASSRAEAQPGSNTADAGNNQADSDGLRSLLKNHLNDYFDGPGRRVFGRDTLVFFLQSPRPNAPNVQATGVVVDRRNMCDPLLDPLLEHVPRHGRAGAHLCVRVGISSKQMSQTTLFSWLFDNQPTGRADNFFVFNSAVSFFSYEPVLKKLQSMQSVPFFDTLVGGGVPSRPNLPHGDCTVDELPRDIADSVQSDSSQVAALQQMLNREVVLVQGPPGTGKTFVGVQMVKAALHCADANEISSAEQGRRPLQILCLCYTNHALDNFLEALLEEGVPASRIIRLGVAKKASEQLKKRCLKNLKDDSNVGKFTGQERWHYRS